MEFFCFFIIVSCAVYAAYEILRFVYGAIVALLARLYKTRRGDSRNRRT